MSASSTPDRAARSGAFPYLRLYAGLLQTLETCIDSEKFSDVFAALRGGDESADISVVAADPDVQRMLIRMGVLDARTDLGAAAKVAEQFIREMADAANRRPIQVGGVLRIYTCGLYGLLPRGICGNVPRCSECGITKECDYYNAPPKRKVDRLPPGKRLAQDGAGALSDEELLLVLLAGSRTDETARTAVKTVLQRFGTLRALAKAGYQELAGLRDVNEPTALRLVALAALHDRLLSERRTIGPSVRCGRDFYDLYAASLRDLRKEVFLVVLLDQKHRVMRDERVSEGSLTASIVHPREVFGPAIRDAAAAVGFIHNHPSGDPTPSAEDIAITRRLQQTAEVVGIRLLDHVIVGEGSYTSFVDEGLL